MTPPENIQLKIYTVRNWLFALRLIHPRDQVKAVHGMQPLLSLGRIEIDPGEDAVPDRKVEALVLRPVTRIGR